MKNFLFFLLMLCSVALQIPANEIKTNDLSTLIYPPKPLLKYEILPYRIKKIYRDGKKIMLNDNSIWTIGWWYQSTVNEWNTDDEVTLSYHSESSYNFIQFNNITADQTAWGNLVKEPDISNPEALWIFDIDIHKTLITLSNGAVLRVYRASDVSAWNFEPGDILTILHENSKEYPYGLYNHTKRYILHWIRLHDCPQMQILTN